MERLIVWLSRRWQHLVDWILPVPTAPMPMAAAPVDRHALFERLRMLSAQRAVESEAHQREVDTLTDQWRELQTQADTLHHQINTMQHAAFCASLDYSAQEDRLLQQITEKSSMSVQLLIEELDAELSVLHRTEETVLPSAHRDYVIGKKTMGLETNAISRKRRAAALHAARARAMAMQVEPLTIEQMNTELIRLRKSIPAIEHETLFNERASIVAYN